MRTRKVTLLYRNDDDDVIQYSKEVDDDGLVSLINIMDAHSEEYEEEVVEP